MIKADACNATIDATMKKIELTHAIPPVDLTTATSIWPSGVAFAEKGGSKAAKM